MAGPPISVEVQGAKALRAQLRAAGIGLSDLKAAHASVAGMVVGKSRPGAPVRSGALAASVRGSGQAGAAMLRAGRASVPYANPIHWGWPARNIPAHPWLWATVEDEQPAIVAQYTAAVQALMDAIDTRGGP